VDRLLSEQRRLRRHPRGATLGDVDGVEGAVLGGDDEGASVAAAEGLADGVAGKAGVVGLLGEVGEDDGAEAVVVELADQLGGGAVGEMAVAPADVRLTDQESAAFCFRSLEAQGLM
jgi:hypothetical protein